MPLPKEEKPEEEWVRRLESMQRSASQGFWILVGSTLFGWVVTNAIAKVVSEPSRISGGSDRERLEP
jgi:hypothetical protein